MKTVTMTPDEKRAARRARYAECPDFRALNYQRKREWIKRNPAHWSALERARHLREPFLRLVMKSRMRARKSGIPNDLTMGWARERWTGKCEITGAEFFNNGNGKQNAFSPSLDKIDPAQGYLQTNCRFILCALNRFKGDEGDDVMYRVARLLIGN